MDLDLSLIVNISLSLSAVGLSAFNPNNLAIFTDEQPAVAQDAGYAIYYTAKAVGVDYGTNSKTYNQAVAVFAQERNILAGRGYLVVVPMLSPASVLETILTAHTRLSSLVQYAGILTNVTIPDNDFTAMANAVQAQNKRFIYARAAASNVTVTTGKFWQMMNTGNSHTRCLLYVGSADQDDANNYAAAYASRNMSTDFGGTRTFSSPQMKVLKTILSDTGMTPTIYQAAQVAGVDVYASIGTLARTLTSGKNGGFFDSLYGAMWLEGALQVAGVNALSETDTKFAQTEEGVESLTSFYREVMEQGVTVGYLSPGTWTDPDTFGKQADFLRNIQERGYYMYSNPVATQPTPDRVARQSPLLQIAAKEAGAVHSSNLLININP